MESGQIKKKERVVNLLRTDWIGSSSFVRLREKKKGKRSLLRTGPDLIGWAESAWRKPRKERLASWLFSFVRGVQGGKK